jgi:hypothetical protein
MVFPLGNKAAHLMGVYPFQFPQVLTSFQSPYKNLKVEKKSITFTEGKSMGGIQQSRLIKKLKVVTL